MCIEQFKKVYFLGIGGIGMSSIAQYLHKQGIEIFGYDASKTPLCEKLENEGIHIHYQPDPTLIPDDIDVFIYTPAIPADFPEWEKIKSQNKPILKRIECLAKLIEEFPTVAIAGTHGKTTVTGLISHTLHTAEIPIVGFIGGILKSYDSNLIYAPHPQWAVVEADEYDRSFLHLSPTISIVNAIEADHLDIYENEDSLFEAFSAFIEKTKPQGKVLVSTDVRLSKLSLQKQIETYGIDRGLWQAQNISPKDHHMLFDVYLDGKPYLHVDFPFPGLHQVKNCLAAISALHAIGLPTEKIKESLESFPGIKRRFEIIYQNNKLTYIDDYAHHPTEIKALIEALRIAFPAKTIKGIFQPHLYSRTRDLADDFAASLDLLDIPLITDIYPAREEPLPGISPQFLLNKMTNPRRAYLPYQQIPDEIANSEDIVVTIGAGNADLLTPTIIEKIKKNES